MTQVFVDGIGGISEVACKAADFEELAKGKTVSASGIMYEFPSEVPSGKLRRCCRYIKMSASGADFALKDSSPYDNLDPYRIGTMIATGYGSSEYYIKFADQVVRHEPPICSPAVFSQTVPNSCAGQICIINGFKGSGTVFRGGDPLEYATLLLKLGRADMMLCGQAEEWSDEVFASVRAKYASAGSTLTEGAAFMTLRTERTEHTYCEVNGFSSANIGSSPLLEQNQNIGETIQNVLADFAGEKTDMIFTSANGTWFDDVEKKAISGALGDISLTAPKKRFGEALGSSYLLSAVLASASLKLGSFDGQKCTSAIVTGFDMSGNYFAVRLTAVNGS